MKSTIFTLLAFCFLQYSDNALAGNGVERGSVMIKNSKEIDAMNPEILKFLSKKLVRCSNTIQSDYFEVSEISLRREKIDQGIIDYFYKIKLNHISKNAESLNRITVEILDSDFHNWRDYEEKLSLEILNDQNNQCL
jgi:hypothetical protein